MKKIFLLSILFLANPIHSQNGLNYDWSKVLSSNTGNLFVNNQAIDENGNVFLVGRYNGSVDFNTGIGDSILSSTALGETGFIAKYNISGDFEWVRELTTTYGSDFNEVCFDESGFVYLMGRISQNADIDLGTTTQIISTTETGIIYKLNSSGDVLANYLMGHTASNAYTTFKSIKSFGSNLFLVGEFYGEVAFNPPFAIVDNSTGGNVERNFIVKLNSDLSYNSRALTYINCYDFAINTNGNLLLAGEISSYSGQMLDIDPGTGIVSYFNPNNNEAALILEFDNSLGFIDFKNYMSTTSGSLYIYGIEIDSRNNDILIGLEHSDTLDIDLGNSIVTMIPGYSYSELLLRYNSDFELQWVKRLEHLPTTNQNFILDMHTDSDGSSYLGFRLTGDVNYSDGIQNLTITGIGSNALIMKWDNSGNYLWNRVKEQMEIKSIKTDKTGTKLFMVGDLYGTSDAAPNPPMEIISPVSTSYLSSFCIKWNTCEIDSTVSSFNGVFTSNETSSFASYQWFDCSSGAPISGETNPIFIPTYNGSFELQIVKGSCVEYSGCITINNVNLKENFINEVNIFPNPTSSDLSVYSKELISNVKIYSLTGQIQEIEFKENSEGILVDLSKLSSGVYLLEYSINNKTITQKIQKL